MALLLYAILSVYLRKVDALPTCGPKSELFRVRACIEACGGALPGTGATLRVRVCVICDCMLVSMC